MHGCLLPERQLTLRYIAGSHSVRAVHAPVFVFNRCIRPRSELISFETAAPTRRLPTSTHTQKQRQPALDPDQISATPADQHRHQEKKRSERKAPKRRSERGPQKKRSELAVKKAPRGATGKNTR